MGLSTKFGRLITNQVTEEDCIVEEIKCFYEQYNNVPSEFIDNFAKKDNNSDSHCGKRRVLTPEEEQCRLTAQSLVDKVEKVFPFNPTEAFRRANIPGYVGIL